MTNDHIITEMGFAIGLIGIITIISAGIIFLLLSDDDNNNSDRSEKIFNIMCTVGSTISVLGGIIMLIGIY